MSQPEIILHGVELSGHCHRVILLLRMLELPYRFAAAPAEVRRSAAFLRLNPLGQIPVLEDGPASGGADISDRGGRPGFVRVEGETLSIPDFRGNRYFTTLGNLSGDPRAVLLFVDFETGDLLQLQGVVEIDWSAESARRYEGAERLWYFRMRRGWRRGGGSGNTRNSRHAKSMANRSSENAYGAAVMRVHEPFSP